MTGSNLRPLNALEIIAIKAETIKHFWLLSFGERKNRTKLNMGCQPFSLRRRCKVSIPKGKILKEKRARLYIIKRCVMMLICWREDGDQ